MDNYLQQDHRIDALRYFLESMKVKKLPWYKVWWIKVRRYISKMLEI